MFSSVLFRKIFFSILIIVLAYAVAIYIFSVPRIRDSVYEIRKDSARTILDNVYNLLRSEYLSIEAYKKSAIDFHKKQLRNIVLLQESFLNNKYHSFRQGLMSETEAKRSALEELRSFRYGDRDYLWVANYDNVLISHPDPKLHNADFSEIRDAYGNLIVPPMVRVAREKGEGYTRYWWQRLGESSPMEKLTYSKDFTKWKWVIGSGVYIDDVKNRIARRKQDMIEEIRQILRKVKIARTGYMYIFDSHMNMIIHPNSNIENTDFSDLMNPLTGNPIGRELITAAHSPDAVLYYKWDKPDDKNRYIYEKISLVRYFREFDWYVASSIYAEELNVTADMLRTRILIVSVIMFLLSIAAASIFLNKLLIPIRTLSHMALMAKEGDLTVRCGAEGKGEIAVLAASFNSMITRLRDSIRDLDMKVSERTQELTQANEQLLQEIEERLLVEDSLRESEERYRTILGNIEDGYYEVNLAGKIIFFNDSLCRHLGYEKEELENMDFRRLMSQKTARKVVRIFKTGFATGKLAKAFDWKLIRKDGSRAYTEISVSLIRNSEARPVGFRGIARDVTERKKTEKKLAYLAYHDTLTGLYNRKAFLEQLEIALTQARQYEREGILFYIDLDRFKTVNDTHGHKTGDSLLKEVAHRLRMAVRETDHVCRIGGDEFTIILNNLKEIHPEQVAERIEKALAAPYHVGDNIIDFITSSIGISIYPTDARDADSLINCADMSMYKAKTGKNRYVRYSDLSSDE